MTDFANTVSHMIENQFPALYQDEGAEMVAFVKAYYEFLENTDKYHIKVGREMFGANDIDESLEEFITHFKQKYLADIPYVTATDKRFMIKHIMDMYRSKGSIRSLELFMRMVFGEEVDVYLPGQDMLRASDSDWYRPIYLEVSKSPKTTTFINRQITGTRSGAQAFVEGIVTKRIAGKHIDVLYLSEVRGTFKFNERITVDGDLDGVPIVNGSLTDINLTLGGRDNVVGDVYDVVSDGGTQGKVRISAIEDATGRVDFELIDGGYGFTNTDDETATDVYVSDAVLAVDNSDPRYKFLQYERVVQRIETISTLSATDINDAQVGDYLVGVDGTGAAVANGVVISVANTDANGAITTDPSANSIIKLQAVDDTTFADQKLITTSGSTQFITGEIIEEQSKVTLDISSLVGSFGIGEIAQQITREPVSNTVVDVAFGTITSANSTELVLEPAWGTFVTTIQVEQKSDPGITAAVDNVTLLPVDAGARGTVSGVNGANVTVNDLFGTFDVSNQIRGASSRLIDTVATVSTSGAVDLWLNGVNTANGVIDLVANTYADGIIVGQNTSAIGISGNTSPFEFDEDHIGDFYIETVRDALFSIPKFEQDDPTFEYTPTLEFPQGVIDNPLSSTRRAQQVILRGFTSFPSPLADGLLFEFGGTGVGIAASIQDSVAFPGKKRFFISSGDGDALAPDPNERIDFVIEETDLPDNLGDTHEFHIHVDPDLGTMQVWISNRDYGTANTGDGSPMSLWTGSGDGGYGESISVMSGHSLIPWAGTITGTLDYFDNIPPNPNAVAGAPIDFNRPIVDIKTGNDAGFEIGFLENTDTVVLNTDITGANNVTSVPYGQILLNGEGAGVGFIDSITITTPGTQYTNGSIVTFTGGGYGDGEVLVDAIGTITTDGAGAITVVTMTEPGEGFFGAPTPVLPATGGTTAVIEPVMDFGYGFPALPDGDVDNLIGDLLSDDTFTIGTIASLTRINPGANYNADPFIDVNNKFVSGFGRRDFIAEVDTIVGAFTPGETITQDVGGGSTAKGKVKSFVNNGDGTGKIEIERNSFNISFLDGVPITGSVSGASANIVNLLDDQMSRVIGNNADVDGTVIAANGIATEVEIIDSGYGYVPFEPVSLEREGFPFIIEGEASVDEQGISEGYWRTTTSHLNSEKKLQDSKYYQEYSYDVISGISLNRYKDALKDVLHVSGNELFGSITKKSILQSDVDIAESLVIVEGGGGEG